MADDPNASGGATPPGGTTSPATKAASAAPAPKGKTTGKSLGELATLSDEDLQKEAKSQGVTVSGRDGAAPTRADYIAALTSGIKSGRMDETIPGGKYTNEHGKLVNAFGQLIHDNGKLVDPDERPKTASQPMV